MQQTDTSFHVKTSIDERAGRRLAQWLLALIIVSWIVFQGAPVAVIRELDLQVGDTRTWLLYERQIIGALAAVIAGFVAGHKLAMRVNAVPAPSKRTYPNLFKPTQYFLLLTALPVIVWTVIEAISLKTAGYGNVDPLSRELNLTLYVTLTLLPIVLANTDKRLYALLIAIILIPRFMISLYGPRFFLLQGLIPVILWTLRNDLTKKQVVVGAGAAVTLMWYLLFLNPTLRESPETGIETLIVGSPVNLLPISEAIQYKEKVSGLDVVGCELIASQLRTDYCRLRERTGITEAARLRTDHIFTDVIREVTGLDAIGTGGNPIIEASPSLIFPKGLWWFAIVGLISGYIARSAPTSEISLFLLPHVTAKVLFLWRGTIAEFLDRIPVLLLTYLIIKKSSEFSYKSGHN